MNALDAADLRILVRLQTDSTVSASGIGAEIGLSAAAVQRRIKRLRQTGVIDGIAAHVNPVSVGVALSCIVAVELERDGAVHLASFKRRVLEMPEVQQCYYVTGPSDCILIVLSRDLSSFERFTQRAFLMDANVKSFTTHVVLERVKVGLEIDLSPGE